MEQKDLGYLAGIIDGEGSISINCLTRLNNTKNYRAYVSVTNTNNELLLVCKALLEELAEKPLSVQLIDQRGRRPVYRLREQSKRGVHKILLAVLPYLVAKKKQAEEVLNFLEFACGSTEQVESRSKVVAFNRGVSSNS